MSDTPAKPVESTTVVQFPHEISEEERARRIMVVAQQLANKTPGEWKLWYEDRAKELGIKPEQLAELVEVQIKANEKKAREEKQTKREADKEEKQAEKEDRKRETAAERAKEQKAERERREAEKAAEDKNKEKTKSFANLLKLPVDRHDGELVKLARRLGDDLEVLRRKFKDFAGVADGFSMPDDGGAEPCPEPVDIAELLQDIDAKIRKHVVLQTHQRTGVTLWVAMSWIHNDIAVYSPILTATSAEAGSGKTELLKAVARLVPKPSMNVETTGPNVFRFVDAHKPTLIIDEADDLFTRKSDLKHIINSSWTRGTRIPRQVNIGGVFVTVHFDPFCPKAIGLIGNLPRTLKTRSIVIRMVPKRFDEMVEPFDVDDFEFAILRRKLARFAADNAATLKTTQPTFPPAMNNRVAANWKLLLAIAELAGGDWPEQAREAAERLSRSGRQPSDGVRLLAAFKSVFAETGKSEITSESMVIELCRNPLDIWATYHGGGRITQRMVAALLDAFDINPVSLHPTKRKDFSRQGYKLTQFADVFARYLPEDPIIQSPTAPKRRTTKRKKRKAARRK